MEELINDRIKKLRRSLGLTQTEFAGRIGTSQNVLANWESGRRNPSASVINNICKEFNLNETWLRTGEGETFVPEPENELGALKERYNLSPTESALIDVFVHMNEKDRKTVLDFVLNAADTIRENDLFFGVPETPEELEAKYPPVRTIKKDVG